MVNLTPLSDNRSEFRVEGYNGPFSAAPVGLPVIVNVSVKDQKNWTFDEELFLQEVEKAAGELALGSNAYVAGRRVKIFDWGRYSVPVQFYILN